MLKIIRPVIITLAFFCSISGYSEVGDYLKEAQKHIKKGDLDKAAQALNLAEKEETNITNPEFWYTKGYVAMQAAQSSVYAYEQIYDDPLMVSYRSYKNALSFTSSGSELLTEHKKEIEQLQRLLFNEAGKHYNKQEFTEAIHYFTPLIDLKPNADYFVNRGIAYLRTELFLNAQADFKKALDLGKNDKAVRLYYLDAILKDKTTNFSATKKSLNELIVIFPEDIDIQKKKIVFYEQRDSVLTKGDREDLKQTYKKVLQEEPGNMNVSYNYAVSLYNKAVVLREARDLEQSKKHAEEAIKVIELYLEVSDKNKEMFESIKRKSRLLVLE